MDRDTILEILRISASGSGSKFISGHLGINRTSIINTLTEHEVKKC